MYMYFNIYWLCRFLISQLMMGVVDMLQPERDTSRETIVPICVCVFWSCVSQYFIKAFLFLSIYFSAWNWIFYATLYPWMKACFRLIMEVSKSKTECRDGNVNADTLSFYHSKYALYRGLHAISRVECAHNNKYTVLRSRSFNYKYSYNTYFSLFQWEQESFVWLEGTDRLTDDFCHLHKNWFFSVASLLSRHLQ